MVITGRLFWAVLLLGVLGMAGSADAQNMRRGRGSDNAPKVGDIAPDFTLEYLEGDKTATLSDYAGESDVVLIFGSYT